MGAEHMQDQSHDALSEILRLARLKNCVYFQSDFTAPWGMEMGASPFAQYHVVVRGQCWLTLKGERHLLATGDVVLLPWGDAHTLKNDPSTEAIPGQQVLAAIQSGEQPFQDGEVTARLLCGHFELDRNINHPFMRDLPNLIHIKGMGMESPNWIEAITPMLIGETGMVQPGTEIIVERLAEVLLIQVLRSYLFNLAEGQGFLAALADKHINGALKFIHSGAHTEMTLADVAKAVGVSRSSLAVRFKELVGDTPMNYLTNWRMLKAKELIRSGSLPLVDVAEQVGYTSEAAFSRAFKREHSQSPSAFRRGMAPSGTVAP